MSQKLTTRACEATSVSIIENCVTEEENVVTRVFKPFRVPFRGATAEVQQAGVLVPVLSHGCLRFPPQNNNGTEVFSLSELRHPC